MSLMFVLEILFRWMHILAAIIAVGGTTFMRLVVLPASEELSDDGRARLQQALRSNWIIPLHASITFLLISGLYNIARIAIQYKLPPWYHPLFGVKFLLALAIFYIAMTLSGRSQAAERMRQKAKFWLTLNMTLAIVLVCISGLLGKAERTKKVNGETPTVESTEAGFNVPRTPIESRNA